jgi:hypothetical protein
MTENDRSILGGSQNQDFKDQNDEIYCDSVLSKCINEYYKTFKKHEKIWQDHDSLVKK